MGMVVLGGGESVLDGRMRKADHDISCVLCLEVETCSESGSLSNGMKLLFKTCTHICWSSPHIYIYGTFSSLLFLQCVLLHHSYLVVIHTHICTYTHMLVFDGW